MEINYEMGNYIDMHYQDQTNTSLQLTSNIYMYSKVEEWVKAKVAIGDENKVIAIMGLLRQLEQLYQNRLFKQLIDYSQHEIELMLFKLDVTTQMELKQQRQFKQLLSKTANLYYQYSHNIHSNLQSRFKLIQMLPIYLKDFQFTLAQNVLTYFDHNSPKIQIEVLSQYIKYQKRSIQDLLGVQRLALKIFAKDSKLQQREYELQRKQNKSQSQQFKRKDSKVLKKKKLSAERIKQQLIRAKK